MGSTRQRGFSLVEVVVVLAVLAVLAGVVVPLALRIFESAAEDATRDEMLILKKAMVGDPNRLQNSSRSDFGFLGDIGRLPSNLDELVLQGPLPGYVFDNGRQTGAGWRGPYITGGFLGSAQEEFKKDGLGNDYILTVGPGGLDGTLISSGPDGRPGTTDDIALALLAAETSGALRGTVRGAMGNGLSGIPMTLHFASGGALRDVTASTDSNGNYSFSGVPFGPHSIEANPASGLLALASGSVSISSNGRDITFGVLNLSSIAVIVSAMSADFGSRGSTNYDQIRIDGLTVDHGSNFRSGDRVSITSTTLAGGPATNTLQRIVVDSPETQVPDIRLGQSGGGTPVSVELRQFNRSMNGVAFTVTFLAPGGAAVLGVVTFVP